MSIDWQRSSDFEDSFVRLAFTPQERGAAP